MLTTPLFTRIPLFLTGWMAFLVFALPLSATQITFSVNMAYQIELGNFQAGTDFVDIAGDFNNWGGTLMPLSDPDQDSIYTATINGFPSGTTIQYKFRINGQWDGTEEFPGGGPNRTLQIGLSTDTVDVWYNDEERPTGPPIAGFSVVSNVIKNGSAVPFRDESDGIVTEWEWSFPGGIPSSSNLRHPSVVYNQPGSYDVRLIARNDSISDTLWMGNFITVQPRDLGQLDWWNETVFYEIFVRSFYDSDGDGIGDFNGLTQQLDYLNDGDSTTTDDLGIEGIWLMPINPSPSYHGYDVTDYRGINPDYGTMQDFENFLAAAHARGIKVIVDYVMNHSSSQHPWFIDSRNNANGRRDFYRWEATNPGFSGPWGQNVWHNTSSGYYYGVFWGGMPDLNYESLAVQDSMWDIAAYWLDDIGVDGFRLDAVKFIYENGSNTEDLPSTFGFWQDFEAHTEQVQPRSLNVGEAWTGTGTVIKYVENGGLDICFEFDLAGNILGAVNNLNADGLRTKMDEVYGAYPHLQWGSFLTNHDMNRVFSVLGLDQGKNKAAASILLTLPGVPFLYYGEEVGMVGVKPDEHIRRPMQWTAGSNGSFTTGNPWIPLNNNFPQYNVATAETDSASLLHHYRDLIHLRESRPDLQTGDYLGIPVSDESVFAFWRMGPQDTSLVVVHTGTQSLDSVSLDLSNSTFGMGSYAWTDLWRQQMDSLLVGNDGQLWLQNLAPHGLRVYDAFGGQPVGQSEAQVPPERWRIFPNPASDYLTLQRPSRNAFSGQLDLISLSGQVLKSMEVYRGSTSRRIDLYDLPPGIYFLQFRSQERVQVLKFIKQ